MKSGCYCIFLWFLACPVWVLAAILAGTGRVDITPIVGTPSAGYSEHKGTGMEGIHDPLLAIALFVDNGSQRLVLCSVDHLGFTYDFTYDMVQKVIKQVEEKIGPCPILIGSSYTHSEGWAYLNIPVLGKSLAERWNPLKHGHSDKGHAYG